MLSAINQRPALSFTNLPGVLGAATTSQRPGCLGHLLAHFHLVGTFQG